MDVTEEKLRKLKRQAWYRVVEYAIHTLVGATLLLTFALGSIGIHLLLEPLYALPNTWYLRLCLHVAKVALLAADLYVFIRFLACLIAHDKRDK